MLNMYLDKETNDAIVSKMRRFDDRELVGKTVAQSSYGFITTGISFTDGTWCAVYPESGCDGPEMHHVDQVDLYELRDLGLITEEQFKTAQSNEREQQRKWKQEKLEQLQKELGV